MGDPLPAEFAVWNVKGHGTVPLMTLACYMQGCAPFVRLQQVICMGAWEV